MLMLSGDVVQKISNAVLAASVVFGGGINNADIGGIGGICNMSPNSTPEGLMGLIQPLQVTIVAGSILKSGAEQSIVDE